MNYLRYGKHANLKVKDFSEKPFISSQLADKDKTLIRPQNWGWAVPRSVQAGSNLASSPANNICFLLFTDDWGASHAFIEKNWTYLPKMSSNY